MQRLDLGGRWSLQDRGRRPRVAAPIPAEVPGVVHTALVAAGELDDPLVGLAEADSQWVGRRSWSYRRSVLVPAALAECEVVEWVCEGLDTLCELRWNGRRMLASDNQFRTWRAELREVRPGSVDLELRCASVFPFLAAKNAERHCPGWGVGVDKDDTGAWVRKSPFNFGW
ncbi:MAG: glycosyl hydrolase 2 galactose-binding domain-containing protein, partial [Planctomycetota bacterium]